ncbi:E3 ubiquitin-protein ligase RNF4 [Mantella aurantiaca]
MNSNQRKRRTSQSTKTRSSHKRRRGSTSTSAMTAVTELIELEESVEEVVDLTCESYEPAVVDLTDLTHNDSVVVKHQDRRRNRNNAAQGSSHGASCILSSDDEDSRNNIYLDGSRSSELTTSHRTRSRSSGGNVSCPICMDGYSEIVQSGRLIVSTKCGHIFCSQCLRDALKNATSCPTCRKKLTSKQYHPIYI